MVRSIQRAREPEIVDRARELFSERGYRETTLQDNADRLGLTRPAFYHYFKSKEEILWKIIHEFGASFMDQAQPVAASSEPPQRKLRSILEWHVEMLLRNQETSKVFFANLDKLQPERYEQQRTDIRSYISMVANVISEGQATGAFRAGSPTAQARLVLGMTNSVIHWFDPAGELAIEQLAKEVSETAVRGLTASA